MRERNLPVQLSGKTLKLSILIKVFSRLLPSTVPKTRALSLGEGSAAMGRNPWGGSFIITCKQSIRQPDVQVKSRLSIFVPRKSPIPLAYI